MKFVRKGHSIEVRADRKHPGRVEIKVSRGSQLAKMVGAPQIMASPRDIDATAAVKMGAGFTRVGRMLVIEGHKAIAMKKRRDWLHYVKTGKRRR
jgi:hypothetical protein